MAIAINGNGTVTGISVGGLPDGIVDTDMLAANAVATAIEKTLPNGSKNIKKIMFKTTMGKAVKVDQVKK